MASRRGTRVDSSKASLWLEGALSGPDRGTAPGGRSSPFNTEGTTSAFPSRDSPGRAIRWVRQIVDGGRWLQLDGGRNRPSCVPFCDSAEDNFDAASNSRQNSGI